MPMSTWKIKGVSIKSTVCKYSANNLNLSNGRDHQIENSLNFILIYVFFNELIKGGGDKKELILNPRKQIERILIIWMVPLSNQILHGINIINFTRIKIKLKNKKYHDKNMALCRLLDPPPSIKIWRECHKQLPISRSLSRRILVLRSFTLIKRNWATTSLMFILSLGDSIEQETPIPNIKIKHSRILGLSIWFWM